VIWESFYWKESLRRNAKDLRHRARQMRWREASLARLEQTVMIGFYSVRKLIEARKLSDATIGYSVSVTVYPSKGQPVTLMNWHKLDRLYDFEMGYQESLNTLDLCNQFIHSYVFAPVHAEDGGIHSILFCSDRVRQSGLYEIELSAIIELFEHVATDYPNRATMWFDPDKGDYQVRAEMISGPD